MQQRGMWLKLTGNGKFLPDSHFDPLQLRTGIKVEMEHTNDPEVAKAIAKDHLVESPLYYKYLANMESDLKQREDVRKVFGW